MTVLAALRLWGGTPVAHALGRALLHFLWEGAAIAALLGALLALARSARARYGLAVAAMLALPLVFGITWLLCIPAGRLPSVPNPAFAYRFPGPLPDGNSLPAHPPSDRLYWLAPLWIAGVLVCYASSLAAWLAAQRLRRRGVCTAPEFWQERLRAMAARLRVSRPVLLLESCLTEIPVTFGWLRPVILLPIGFLSGLPPEQVEAILLHELAHIRRFDYAVNLLASFVEGLLFYHPAVWWISRVVRAERENCCDDLVVSEHPDARAYAAALARLEQKRSLAREALLAANGGNLMKRIRRLLDQPERPRSAAAPAFAIGLLLLAVAAAFAWTPMPKPAPQAPAAQPQPAPQPKRSNDVTSTATGQERSTPYRKWLNEDVAYIITDAERAAFKNLQTDAEREQFIEQFWKRRDPTPDTERNEFKEEHYRRIAYANEHFSAGIPGWKTDRGRIYITYGPPDEIEDHHAETARAPYQLWRYRYIEGIGQNVVVQFTDPNRNGEYRMDNAPAAIGAGTQVNVHVGANGAATFSVPFDLAAAAYTGTWAIARQGESTVVMQGQFDSRFGSHTVTLQPGAYHLKLTLRDPNGRESTNEVDFTVK